MVTPGPASHGGFPVRRRRLRALQARADPPETLQPPLQCVQAGELPTRHLPQGQYTPAQPAWSAVPGGMAPRTTPLGKVGG